MIVGTNFGGFVLTKPSSVPFRICRSLVTITVKIFFTDVSISIWFDDATPSMVTYMIIAAGIGSF